MLYITFWIAVLLTKCDSVVAKRKLYYSEKSRDADQMEKYYGDFKGSYELYASSWNESFYRHGGSIYIENYKSSSKVLWIQNKNLAFLMQKTWYNFLFFPWSVTRCFLTLSVFFNIPKENCCTLGFFNATILFAMDGEGHR